ncbi:GumC family protein [Skermanella stibiiresistens]|nr:polysaccharide biosynthesis tyrosine autokinase [Skermanella stibiiresistens]
MLSSPISEPAPPSARPAKGDEIDLGAIMAAIKRRRGTILGLAVACTAIGIGASYAVKPTYWSEAVVSLNVRGAAVTDNPSVIADLKVDNSIIRGEIDIVTSRTAAGRVVDALGLKPEPVAEDNGLIAGGLRRMGQAVVSSGLFDRVAGLIGPNETMDKLRRGLAEPPAAPVVVAQDPREQMINTLLNNVSAANDGRSYSIRIGYNATTSEQAATIANAFANEYLKMQRDEKVRETVNANEWLKRQVQVLREDVLAAETRVQKLQETAGLTDATRGGSAASQQMASLNVQLVAARAAVTQAEAKLRSGQDMARTRGGIDSAAAVLESPMLQLLARDQTEIKRKMADLSSQYGDRHPTIIGLKSELASVDQRIKVEMDRTVQALTNDVAVARASEQSLQTRLRQLESNYADGAKIEIQVRQFQREADAARELYQSFLQRMKETGAQAELARPDARIISDAVESPFPAFPNRKLFAVIGLVMGLFLGLFIAFVAENIQRGFNDLDDLEGETGIPGFGSIPLVRRRGKRSPVDYLLEKPISAYSESLRTVQSLIHSVSQSRTARVILVTSAVASEGKSTFCVSLTRQLALGHQKVLLIDGDLRRSRLLEVLPGKPVADQAEAPADLIEVLEGKREFGDAIHVDEATGLHYLATSRHEQNPQRLLMGRSMQNVITQALRHYDLVVIDAPPVMAVSDALVLARYADASLLMVRWNKTSRKLVLDAVKRLRVSGVKVSGAVMTMVDQKKKAKSGYEDYSYRNPYYAD